MAMAEEEAQAPQARERAGADELLPVFFMGLLFVASILLALASAPVYSAENVRVFEDPQDLANVPFYLVLVVAFTALILVIARYGLKKLIRVIILGSVLLALAYVIPPLLRTPFRAVLGDPAILAADIAGIAAGVAITALLYLYPEWWVIDIAGIGFAAGAAAIFGISFGLLPALLLLVAFAVYDAIAVYRTKHMIDLADSVLEMRLPIMLVVPKKRGYSFLKETQRLKESVQKDEPREAMFMGLGDIVIPAVLIVSAVAFLQPPFTPSVTVVGLPGNWAVALSALAGACAGYVLLMWFVLRGKPQAGLPSLNGGTIAGFFLALLPLYGLGPLVPV